MDNKKIHLAKAHPKPCISYACLLTLLMRSFHFALLSVRMTTHVMQRLVRSIALILSNLCKKLLYTKLLQLIPSLRGLKASGNLIKRRILSIAFQDCFAPRCAFSLAITTKKGFTFAELMISLVVISILAAVLYPNLMHFNPNSNKPLFKAAYKILSNALAEITVDKDNGTLTTAGANTGQLLCIDFCNKANVVDEQIAPNNTCNQNCNDNILTTSNGMRWLFENYGVYPGLEFNNGGNKNAFRITVDVNSSNSNLTSEWHCTTGAHNFHANTAGANNYGIFCYDSTNNVNNGAYTATPAAANVNGTFNLDHAKAQDTFQFLVDEKGKIISISPVGWAILEDNVQLD